MGKVVIGGESREEVWIRIVMVRLVWWIESADVRLKRARRVVRRWEKYILGFEMKREDLILRWNLFLKEGRLSLS
jgi:hypothetical protein